MPGRGTGGKMDSWRGAVAIGDWLPRDRARGPTRRAHHMDAIRFDRLTRVLAGFSSRRAVAGAGLTGLVSGVFGLTDTEARRKKRRKKCKPPCRECERCK